MMINMLLNKKGQDEEGMHFNLKRLSILILFVVLIAIGIIILIPRLSAEAASKTTSGFGEYVYDILVGGKG
jgi:preprotein translocase subunit SecY